MATTSINLGMAQMDVESEDYKSLGRMQLGPPFTYLAADNQLIGSKAVLYRRSRTG